MKHIETLWFTNIKGCVGLAIIEEDRTGDRKGYIGVVSGRDEKADTEDLLAWGTKFTLSTAQDIVQKLTKEVKP